jgi:hypothetical protein
MKMELSFIIRQIAASCFAGTLAWDYTRDSSAIGNFSIWILAVHFIYFQLPLKSKAIALIHPTSFLGATIIPVMYAYLLFWNPSFEINHMEQWEVAWSTVVIRAFLIYLAPLFFHALDITANQTVLIYSYKIIPEKLLLIWTVISIPLLG